MNKSIRLFTILALSILSYSAFSVNVPLTITTDTWVSNAWQPYYRSTLNYDTYNFLISGLFENWNTGTSSWTKGSLTTYTNNSDGTINYYISQSWDNTNSIWVNSSKTTYTYNAYKKVLTQLIQSWSGSAWQNSMLYTNTYDTYNYLIIQLQQLWNTGTSMWDNNTQTSYNNNADGTVQQAITSYWYGSSWTDSEKITITYTAFEKKLTELWEIWTGTSWINNQMKTYTYDSNHFLIAELTQNWDMIYSIWNDQSRSNLTNNSDGSPSIFISQNWNTTTTAWDNVSRTTWSYSIASGISENKGTNSLIKIYPNLVKDFVHIDLNNKEINNTLINFYAVDGKIMFAVKPSDSNFNIDMSNFSKGVYLVKVSEGNKLFNYKLVKE